MSDIDTSTMGQAMKPMEQETEEQSNKRSADEINGAQQQHDNENENENENENDTKRIKINQGDVNVNIDTAIPPRQISETTSENLKNDEAIIDVDATNDNANINTTTSPAVVEDNQSTSSDPIPKSIGHSRGHMIITTNTNNPSSSEKRWRAHRQTEDYITLASNMMLPATHLAPFGYDAPSGQYPIESITALSILTSPLRRPTVIEKWCPYEIAVFEAALALCGKHFHRVQKFVKSKCTKEVIEFYYVWKKTGHYKVWKRQFVQPEDDVDSDDD